MASTNLLGDKDGYDQDEAVSFSALVTLVTLKRPGIPSERWVWVNTYGNYGPIFHHFSGDSKVLTSSRTNFGAVGDPQSFGPPWPHKSQARASFRSRGGSRQEGLAPAGSQRQVADPQKCGNCLHPSWFRVGVLSMNGGKR